MRIQKLLEFKGDDVNIYTELENVIKVTGNLMSKEIREAIKNHVEYYKMEKLFERALKNNHTLHEEILIAVKQYLKPKKKWFWK